VLHTLKTWPTDHPLLYPFLLFLLGAMLSGLFSVYAQEVKHFLHHWPRAKKRAFEVALNTAMYRLAILKRLHNDSYQVLLYFWSKVDYILYEAFLNGLLIYTVRIFPTGREYVSWWLFGGLVFGAVFSCWWEARWVLRQLLKYEESVQKLERSITEMQQRGTLLVQK
jgi:hypothetical protein